MDKAKKEALLQDLYSYSMHGIKLGLDNIRLICEALGNPQDDFVSIHIAGTNGKGSVSTILSTILQCAGYKVGRYTSPHIIDFNERITIGETPISDEDIAYYYEQIKQIAADNNITPTFFEITTAIMFAYFRDQQVNVAIIEVGMGGRYDATNVINAAISVITNVTLEHTEYLGNTVYEIACEKAGIIKDTPYIVTATNDEDVARAISEATAGKLCKVVNVLKKYRNTSFELDYQNFTTNIDFEDHRYVLTLFGTYQYKNFLCAYEVAHIMGVEDDVIYEAVTKVVWPCRFEKISENPLVILDGAHNEDGMRELRDTVTAGYKTSDVTILTSILKDKNIEAMMAHLEAMSDRIIFTDIPDNPRGTTGDYILGYMQDQSNGTVEHDLARAYELALESPRKLTLVCGSFYLLSNLKNLLAEK